MKTQCDVASKVARASEWWWFAEDSCALPSEDIISCAEIWIVRTKLHQLTPCSRQLVSQPRSLRRFSAQGAAAGKMGLADCMTLNRPKKVYLAGEAR